MTKKFKKVYIEITNHCNLNCSFCSLSNKQKRTMTTDEFEHILKEIKEYTDYIYLHVKGEPLLHPKLDQFLSLAEQYQMKVNITTNGTLFSQVFKVIKKHPCIHQINFSLHCEQNNSNYCEEIFSNVSELSTNIVIIYRFWTLKDANFNKESTIIVDKIKNFYNLSTETVDKLNKEQHIPISKNIFVDKQKEFIWPSLENNYCNKTGYCYGLKSHISILVDGTVVPCCLDSEGIINLGNIFEKSLIEILSTDRVENIRKGFSERKAIEKLCQHCSFKNRF